MNGITVISSHALRNKFRSFYHIMESCNIYGAMTKWLGHWIPNPGVQGPKPLCGCKINSTFQSSKVNQMSTRNCRGLNGKK